MYETDENDDNATESCMDPTALYNMVAEQTLRLEGNAVVYIERFRLEKRVERV